MTFAYYADVHINLAIVVALRAREVDVLTAQEDGSARLRDPQLLARATALQRVLLTEDKGLLALDALWRRQGREHAGIVHFDRQKIPVGQCIDALELLALGGQPADIVNQVVHLRSLV